jgi:hypothetical protein
MSHPRTDAISPIWLLIAVVAVAALSAPAHGQGGNTLCTHQYVLCTSAPSDPLGGLGIEPGQQPDCSSVRKRIGSVQSMSKGVAVTPWRATPRSTPCIRCTSAPCVPLPGDTTKAICTCQVEEGKSMSTVPCATIEPSTDANGIRTVYSTFSLEQFEEGKKGMTCPSGSPWTWCLNRPCTVDQASPKKAICTCDVVRTGEWMTLGGACDTSTCKTGYWSGASITDFESGNAFMTKALGLEKSPAAWCPSPAAP